MTYNQTNHSWRNEQRWPPYVNVASGTIPAYAVMMAEDASVNPLGGTRLNMTKPDGVGTIFAINSNTFTTVAKHGRFTMDYPAAVLCQDTGEVGPTANSWEMSNQGTGFETIGQVENNIVLVVPKAVAADSHFTGITILEIPAATKHTCNVSGSSILTLGKPGFNGGSKNVSVLEVDGSDNWQFRLDSLGAPLTIAAYNPCLKIDICEMVMGSKAHNGKWIINQVCCPED